MIADIPGYPGYAATVDGQIITFWKIERLGRRGSRSYIGDEGVPLRSFDRKDIRKRLTGYRSVNLRIGKGRSINRYVHELVLYAFVGPRPSPDHEALHGNGDRADNRLDNLRWGTVLENAADRELHGHVLRGAEWWTAKRKERAEAKAREAAGFGEDDHELPEPEFAGAFDDLLGGPQFDSAIDEAAGILHGLE